MGPRPPVPPSLQLAKPLPKDREGRIALGVQTMRLISSPQHFDEPRVRSMVEQGVRPPGRAWGA